MNYTQVTEIIRMAHSENLLSPTKFPSFVLRLLFLPFNRVLFPWGVGGTKELSIQKRQMLVAHARWVGDQQAVLF